MKTSQRGIDLMHKFEGFRSKPYLCPAHLWTVGYGHVLYDDQIKLPVAHNEAQLKQPVENRVMLRRHYQLKPEDNRVWPKAEIDQLFEGDLVRFERGVLRLVPAVAGRQGAFDALVCLSYNIGLGGLQRSTVRMKANRGDWQGAAEAFMAWTKGGGKVLPGLVARRKAEVALFLSEL